MLGRFTKSIVSTSKAPYSAQLSRSSRRQVQRKLQLPVVFKANSIHTSSLLRNQASTPTAAPAKPQSSSQQQPTIAQFDVRIGRIIEIQKHPNADSLYVEKIDVGEEKPRTIVSGLVHYIPEDQLLNKHVLVVCNMPAKAMRGITSEGMLLAAASENEQGHRTVALVVPPEGSQPGDKLVWEAEMGVPDATLSGKRIEKILKCLRTDAAGVPIFTDGPQRRVAFKTAKGACSSPLSNATVS